MVSLLLSRPTLLPVLLLLSMALLRAAPVTNIVEGLTLEQAVALAEAHHPGLAEARALATAAAARADQAGRLPNPELIGRVESAPLGGDTLGRADYLGGLAQSVPLGGRLGRAREVGQLEVRRQDAEQELLRRDLRRAVHSTFATVLYQEQALLAQQEILAAAETATAVARARVEAGDAVPAEAARAELEAVRARVAVRTCRGLRDQALNALAGALGSPGLEIRSVEGDLETTFEVPALEALTADLAVSPAITAANAEVAAREAQVALARAERVPDVRVEALYRRIESEREDSFDVGFSVPLPLFDRGQGRLRAARAEAGAAQARATAGTQQLLVRLRQAHLALGGALERVAVLRQEVLPRATAVRDAAELRVAAGDVPPGEAIQARRDWAAARLDHLEALRDALLARAELQALR